MKKALTHHLETLHVGFNCIFCGQRKVFEVKVKKGHELTLEALNVQARKVGWVAGT